MRIGIVPLLAIALPLAACESAMVPLTVEQQLDEVRQLTIPYANVGAAQATGYTVWAPDPAAANATCPSSDQGRMAYHLVNVGLRGSPSDTINADANLDYRKPEMLLYEKTSSGELRLVGVEYLVFKATWERVHGKGAAAPELFGRPVPASRHAFAPGGPEIDHYELHVWVHSNNPNGMFSHWNPNISC
jgi:hypothetical protein